MTIKKHCLYKAIYVTVLFFINFILFSDGVYTRKENDTLPKHCCSGLLIDLLRSVLKITCWYVNRS